MITGATMLCPNGIRRGAPAIAHSSSKIRRCVALQPVPPYSTGQDGAPQPCAYRILCQRTVCSRDSFFWLSIALADVARQMAAQEPANLFAKRAIVGGGIQVHRSLL
jgi:hypothetical protein